MKLILLTILQSALTVGGMGLINLAVDGKPLSIKPLMEAMLTWQGLVGVALLIGSFLTTTAVLSFARMAVFIPLNTGLVFLFTVLFAVLVQDERMSIPMMFGMALIVVGIGIVAQYR